jgi:hypothetical protein
MVCILNLQTIPYIFMYHLSVLEYFNVRTLLHAGQVHGDERLGRRQQMALCTRPALAPQHSRISSPDDASLNHEETQTSQSGLTF